MESNKEKSSRNKTLDISVEEGKEYLERVLKAENFDFSSPDLLTDKTILGDTFSVLPKLPLSFVDLAVCDPPYNLSKNYSSMTFNARSRKEYKVYTESWLSLLLPLLKENASLYICCDWRTSLSLGEVLSEYEEKGLLFIQNRITWQREKGRGARNNWKNSMEDIWFCSKSSEYNFNLEAVKVRRRVIAPYKENGKPKDWKEGKEGSFRDTCPGNFWDDISIPFWSMSENTAHPTQKPEKLLAKLLLSSSSKGDLVFDPFLGSGTTAVVAKKLGRHYLGIEKSEQYLVWAEKRLEDAEEGSPIQGYSDGVFWERNSQPKS